MINKLDSIVDHKSILFTFFLGCLSSLGFEPFNIFFLTIVCFIITILVIKNQKNIYIVFFQGLSFGLGHHLVGLYWIAVSFKVADSGGYILGGIAVFFLCLFLSIFFGLAFFIIKKKCKNILDFRSCLIIILVLSFFDWLKGNVLWGFPWLPISAIWSFDKITLFPFSILGVWGYSLITFSFIAGITLIGKNFYKSCIFIFPLPIFLIYPILSEKYINPNYEKKITIKLIQPNISQNDKWKPENIEKNLRKLLFLSEKSSNKNIDLIIWPETAIAFNLEAQNKYNEMLKKFVKNTNFLLLGAIRIAKEKSQIDVYNSMFLINNEKKIIDVHDKIKLVPFGEFIPFRNILGIDKITAGNNDFKEGETLRILSVKNANILPLICYEVIFPNIKRNYKIDFNLIINITNDAWYGNTSGPYQHFALSKIRAVQEGTTLLRVANNGISGIINYDGEVISNLEYGTEGIVVEEISLYKISTMYKDFGDKLFYGLLIILFTSLIFFEIRLKGNK